MKTTPTTEPEGAVNPSCGESSPSLSLEAVCEYALHVPSDAEADVIAYMLMTQYMQQGLCIPQLAELILGIREKRQTLRREEEHRRLHPHGVLDTSRLPPPLRTPAAINIWQILFTESLVDEECQTLCSRTESGLLAYHIAKTLGIREVWKTFEEVWGMKNLKSAHDKAFDYQSGWNFQKKLDSLF